MTVNTLGFGCGKVVADCAEELPPAPFHPVPLQLDNQAGQAPLDLPRPPCQQETTQRHWDFPGLHLRPSFGERQMAVEASSPHITKGTNTLEDDGVFLPEVPSEDYDCPDNCIQFDNTDTVQNLSLRSRCATICVERSWTQFDRIESPNRRCETGAISAPSNEDHGDINSLQIQLDGLDLESRETSRSSTCSSAHARTPTQQTREATGVVFSELESNPHLIYNKNDDGDTFLHQAIVYGMVDLVYRILIVTTSPFFLDLRNNRLQTALHLAVLTRQPRLVRMLVVRGATVDMQDRHGNTPLHIACQLGDLECVAALSKPIHFSERGPCLYRIPFRRIPQDSAILNYDGDSCLHLAADRGHLAVVRYLTSDDITADVNVQETRCGKTIFHKAVEKRDTELLKYLLESRQLIKLDINTRTYAGATALQLARSYGHVDIANFLKLLGAEEGSYLSDDELSDSDQEL